MSVVEYIRPQSGPVKMTPRSRLKPTAAGAAPSIIERRTPYEATQARYQVYPSGWSSGNTISVGKIAPLLETKIEIRRLAKHVARLAAH